MLLPVIGVCGRFTVKLCPDVFIAYFKPADKLELFSINTYEEDKFSPLNSTHWFALS